MERRNWAIPKDNTMTTDQLNHHIADYCATRPEIVACYLYGSRAKGKERSGSDVDLAFLLDGSVAADEYYNLKMTYYAGLGEVLRLDVHPLIMNNAGEVVLEQVLINGLIVYGADSLEFKQFKMYRCVQIAEFNDYMKYVETLKTSKLPVDVRRTNA